MAQSPLSADFQKKYNTTNVNVITKSKNNYTDNLLQTVDISFNLLDKNYATRRAGGYPGPGILPGEGRTFYISLGIKL